MDDAIDKAVIDIEVFTMQHKEIIWAELALTAANWWKNNPPEEVSHMLELTGCLQTTVSRYFEKETPQLWDNLGYEQQLIHGYQLAAEWLAQQWYHSRKP